MLVTSVDAYGVINVAPKSWVSMAAFAGPTVGFGCNVEHGTHRNIYQTVALGGGEVFIFGTISSIAVEEACLTDELSERYHALNPFFFLEGGWYATLGEPRQATHPEQED